MDPIKKLELELKKIENFFKVELAGLRVGRATPALVENVVVDYYGSKVPLKQVASISAPESRTLIIEPWDKNALPAIEKAIQMSNLGLNPIADKNIIRITIPQLTEERRNSLLKLVGTKMEEARVKSRAKRDEAMKEISDLFDNKEIAEDKKFKMKEEIQKVVERGLKDLENAVKIKEREIKE